MNRTRSRLQAISTAVLAGCLVAGCSATTNEGADPTSGADSTSGTGAAPDASSASEAAAPATDGPGVTEDEVVIVSDYLTQSLDAAGQDPSIEKFGKALPQAVDDVLAAFNADGGLGGRDVVLQPSPAPAWQIEHFSDSTGELDDPDRGAELCEDMTKEGQTPLYYSSMFLGADSGYPDIAACLNAAGVLVSSDDRSPSGALSGWTQADLDQAPTTFARSLAPSQLPVAFTALALDAGFDAAGTTTAVLVDADADEDLRAQLEQELTGAGLEVELITLDTSSQTKSEESSRNAALKIKADGIEQVIATGDPTVTASTVQVALDQQQHYPQMLLFPLDHRPDPQRVTSYVFEEPDSPWADKLAWYDDQPQQEVEPGLPYLNPESPAAQLCPSSEEIAKDYPVEAQMAGVLDGMLFSLCDDLALLRAAQEASGSDHLNAEALLQGLAALEEYVPASGFPLTFAADRPTGSTWAQRYTVDGECRCGSPTGEPVRLVPEAG